jgi:peptidoglycan hydrolase-like protein with peptidoglycan-binding domain/DNA replication initiation complex subunit (GINS family)
MGKTEYRVRSGDKLSSIARNHRTTVDALMRTNWLASEDSIVAGQVLWIEETLIASKGQLRQGVSSSAQRQDRKGNTPASSGSRLEDAPSLSAVSSGNAFLALGMQGPAVRELQRLLVMAGYLSQRKMDTGPGMFGLATLSAVKEFQRANQVAPLGGRPLGTSGRTTFERLYKTKTVTKTQKVAHTAARSGAMRREDAKSQAADAQAMVRGVAGSAEESDSIFDVVWDWLWGTLQGDFNKDPSLSQIAVNTVLGLIPLVDQALDLRDITAGLKDLVEYYKEDDAEQKKHSGVLGLNYELWIWINVFIIAIGCIPEVGSAVKGVLRALIEALQNAGKLADAQLWKTLLPILKRVGISEGSAKSALKELSSELSSWMSDAAMRIKSGLNSIQKLLSSAENFLVSKAAKLLSKKTVDELLASIRKLKAALKAIYERLDAMKAEVDRWLRAQIEKLIGKASVKTHGVVPSNPKPKGQQSPHSTKDINKAKGKQKPEFKKKQTDSGKLPNQDGSVPKDTLPSELPPPKDPPPKELLAPKSLDELYARLSKEAKGAFDQQKQLLSSVRFQEMEASFRHAADGAYDVGRANAFFEKKLVSDAEFRTKLRLLKESFQSKSKNVCARLQNVIDETNGKNRPKASVGDGSSEAALDQEIVDGMPWKCGDGHHGKVENSIKTLQLGIDELQRYREHLTDPKVQSEVDAMIQAAAERIDAMIPVLERWKQRARTHPEVWIPDGTSKNKPGWP